MTLALTSIVGSYHKLSAKHLDAYLDELAWRFRDTLAKLIKSKTLEYKALTA